MVGYVIGLGDKYFSPDGLVPGMGPEQAERHNAELSRQEAELVKTAPEAIYGYYAGKGRPGDVGRVTLWAGVELCQATVTGAWKHLGTHMISVRCQINGHRYRGRGRGDGMLMILRKVVKG